MAFPTAEVLTQRLEPLLAAHNLDAELIKATPAGKKSQVVIRVDGDERPSSDLLEQLSGEISAFFDQLEERGELNFGAGYTLEVSTPGVDLPLHLPRHFRRNRGRLVSFVLADAPGTTLKARIGALNEAGAENGAENGTENGAETEVILVATEKKNVRVWRKRLEDLDRVMVEIEFAQAPAAEREVAELDFAHAAEMADREDEK